jgi:YggT family protein
MDPLFVSSVISNLLSILFLIYLLFRFFELSFLNPIVKYSFSILEPISRPLRLILPVIFNIDFSSLVLSIFFKGLSFYLYVESQSLGTDSVESITWACLSVLLTISLILRYSLFISIIGSWVAPTSNNALLFICHGITQPLLRPFQRLTAFGGIDFSPIIVFFILIQIDRMIHNLRFYLELPGLF